MASMVDLRHTCLTFVTVTPTLWGLAHEGIHGLLAGHPLANRAASRLLCVLLGFSFDTVRFGHLMHHRYNGHHGMHGRGDEAARNLTLPDWAAVLVLNHNLHRAHHERPNLPWQSLPAHVDGAPLDGNYLLAAMRQFRGPIRASE